MNVHVAIAAAVLFFPRTPPGSAHPSGMLTVGAEVRLGNDGWQAESAVVFRTQRRLMQGAVALR